jgi:hypothetical protein
MPFGFGVGWLFVVFFVFIAWYVFLVMMLSITVATIVNDFVVR